MACFPLSAECLFMRLWLEASCQSDLSAFEAAGSSIAGPSSTCVLLSRKASALCSMTWLSLSTAAGQLSSTKKLLLLSPSALCKLSMLPDCSGTAEASRSCWAIAPSPAVWLSVSAIPDRAPTPASCVSVAGGMLCV